MMTNKQVVTAAAIVSFVSSCAYTPTREQSGELVRDELAQVLEIVEPAQPMLPTEDEEVRIPRNAPWLAHRFDAQYADTSMDAIRTVLQGRPVVFQFKQQSNPFVTSPINAVTIKHHLDAISVQADWNYQIDDGVVVFSDTSTEQFYIRSIPGRGDSIVSFNTLGVSPPSASGSGSESQGGTSDGERAENSLEIISTPYADLERTLLTVLEDYARVDGGQRNIPSLSFTESANTLTVSGPPSLLRRVKSVVEDFNYSVNRKVHLIITVYDVSFTETNQRSIDFNLLRQAAIRTSASFGGSSLTPASPGGLSLGLDFFEGNSLDASNVVFNLLRQQGQTSVRLHEAFEATNNIVFSIEDRRTIPYVASVTIDRQDGGSISQLTPSLETDVITTGLGFHVVATIAKDNISMRLSLSQSDLVRFDPYVYGTGSNSISGTFPVTDSQFRVIPITLKDGETRLIANLSQSKFRNTESGSGLGYLGKSNGLDNVEKQTVIAVTAKIL